MMHQRGLSRLRPAWLAVAGSMAVAALVFHDGAGRGEARADSSPYIVGFTDVLSGAYAVLGANLLKGAQTYFNAVNAGGGVNGHKIDFRAIDSQADSTKVVTSIQDLAGAGAVAIAGTSISNNAEAAAPVIDQLHVPLYSPGLSAKLLDPFQPYLFASDITPGSQTQMQIDFVRQQLFPGRSDLKVALFSVQTAGVQAFVAIIKNLIAKQQPGWKIVAEEVVPLASTDVSVSAAKIVGSAPDVIIGGLPDTQAVLGIKAMVSQGFTAPVVNFHGGNAEKTFALANYPAYYAARQYPTTQDANPGKGYSQMLDAMKTAGLYESLQSSYNAINGYVIAMDIVAILKKCGEGCTGETMQKATLAVGQIDTDGLTWKPISFGPDRHQGIDTVRFYHLDGGKLLPAGVPYSGTYGHP